jgi:hypothetical protein
MLRKLRPRRPSHGTVIAYMALFVALGGTAYAVNTVGSTDIIDGQVKSVDIGNGEVGSADVKDNSINTFDVHSLIGEDVIDDTLTGADIGFSSVPGSDITAETVASRQIQDGSLSDRDVGEIKFVDFAAQIPALDGHQCTIGGVTGIPAPMGFDHILLTTSAAGGYAHHIHAAMYTNSGEFPSTVYIQTCNVGDADTDAVTERFNLLVFNSQ